MILESFPDRLNLQVNQDVQVLTISSPPLQQEPLATWGHVYS